MSKRTQWKQREKELTTEIERLMAQVELLTCEVDRLKKMVVVQNPENSRTPEYHETPSKITKLCKCRGKCATKRCACVKDNMSCSELCECSSAICQNKNNEEQNKENVENNEVVHVEAEQTSNKNLINVNRQRGLFSPNTPMDSSTPKPKQYLLSPVQFKSLTQMLDSDSEERTPEQLSQTIEDQNTKNNFDPMKPTRQLARTPVKGSFVLSHTDSSAMILTPDIVQVNEEETTEEKLKVPEELNQPEVDWEKYQAQLVPCNKCKRKFHPDRVKKHQECCKKV